MAKLDSASFEELVRSLLTLAGYKVSGERLVGHKKVDAYAEESTLTSIRRVAVECKQHTSPLTLRQVSEIYGGYAPLYSQNVIDEILIVTAKGLTPNAAGLVANTRELNHLTLTDLQSRVIDFRAYLPGLVREYERSGLPHYYIPPKSTSGVDLEAEISTWLKNGPDQPIAILAGYGMGKSTFASHLAATLAWLAVTDSTQRIPIVVPLGEISSNQDLAGLLGKLFTSSYDIRNYRLESFMALNALGRFVVICDGFDEMKHTLSWEEFRFNLGEINRLVTENSRLIILGRPTAFLDAAEQQFALHGSHTRRGQDIRDRERPDYLEIELAPFDQTQIETFLEKYQEWRIERQLGRSPASLAADKLNLKRRLRVSAAEKRSKMVLKEIARGSNPETSQLADLTGRPVHLKMLIDVLPQWNAPIAQMTVTILYDLFIDYLINREQEKRSRRESFTGAQRREFARKLAWWLWQRGKRAYLRAEEFPEELLLQFGQTKIQGVQRDLIAGSLLDRKAGDVLYFPHRSIQEFLVAEELVAEIGVGLQMSNADASLTDEVYIFLQNLVNISDLTRWEATLKGYRGLLSLRFARLWLSEPQKLKWTNSRFAETSVPWYALFSTAAYLTSEVEVGYIYPIAERLNAKIGSGIESESDLLGFACLMSLSRKIGVGYVIQALDKIIESRISEIERAGDKAPTKRDRIQERKGKRTKPSHNEPKRRSPVTITDQWLRMLEVNRRSQRIRLESGHRLLGEVLQQYCFLSDWVAHSAIRYEDFTLLEDLEVPTQLIQRLSYWSDLRQ